VVEEGGTEEGGMEAEAVGSIAVAMIPSIRVQIITANRMETIAGALVAEGVTQEAMEVEVDMGMEVPIKKTRIPLEPLINPNHRPTLMETLVVAEDTEDMEAILPTQEAIPLGTILTMAVIEMVTMSLRPRILTVRMEMGVGVAMVAMVAMVPLVIPVPHPEVEPLTILILVEEVEVGNCNW